MPLDVQKVYISFQRLNVSQNLFFYVISQKKVQILLTLHNIHNII